MSNPPAEAPDFTARLAAVEERVREIAHELDEIERDYQTRSAALRDLLLDAVHGLALLWEEAAPGRLLPSAVDGSSTSGDSREFVPFSGSSYTMSSSATAGAPSFAPSRPASGATRPASSASSSAMAPAPRPYSRFEPIQSSGSASADLWVSPEEVRQIADSFPLPAEFGGQDPTVLFLVLVGNLGHPGLYCDPGEYVSAVRDFDQAWAGGRVEVPFKEGTVSQRYSCYADACYDWLMYFGIDAGPPPIVRKSFAPEY